MDNRLLKRVRKHEHLFLGDLLKEQYKEGDENCYYELALLMTEEYINTDYPYKGDYDQNMTRKDWDNIEASTVSKNLYDAYRSDSDSFKTKGISLSLVGGLHLKARFKTIIRLWIAGIAILLTLIAIL